ncbi:hypothetical protein [Paludisphaera sp.]|uniref:hypothetical protein n=1 Tax=Paludisphaera sp. TaxID=2017432 RepID=UPI00301CF339
MNLLRIIGLATGVTAAVFAVMLAPDVGRRFLPRTMQEHPVEWAAGALLLGRLAAGAWGRRRDGGRVSRVVERIDAGAGWMLRRGLLPALSAWAVVRLAAWLPHYPFWPWCHDVDNYATFAMHWDVGELPYRDFRAFNFPGHIYLHWALGKLFGWGRPGLVYVVDAAALLTLGGAVVGWSRRRLGSALPGVFSYFVFLAAYLDMHIELVAQRDWHAALGMTLALLTLQALPGRAGRWLSALLAAAAFTVRPQAVLLLPALAVVVLQGGGRERSRGPRAGAARLAEWACAFALFVVAGFAPLMIAGVMGDFVRGLRVVSVGGPYSTFTPSRALDLLWEQLARPTTIPLFLALAALSLRGPLKGESRAWLAAMLGVLAYRPLSPVPHDYLRTPLILVEAVAWAVPVAWCLRAATAPAPLAHAGRRAFLGLFALTLLLYESVPTREPYNCSFPAVVDAVGAAARGGWPDVPPGAWVWFSRSRGAIYPWHDYQRLLEYLRENTGPDTIVANVLRNMPLPPVNGPVGRRSPFRVEAGITWMWMIDEDLDERFARELREAGPDSVVVWVPGEEQPRLPLERLIQTIREEYEPEARFGPLEVWRRKPGA